jgi:hypothetical protein
LTSVRVRDVVSLSSGIGMSSLVVDMTLGELARASAMRTYHFVETATCDAYKQHPAISPRHTNATYLYLGEVKPQRIRKLRAYSTPSTLRVAPSKHHNNAANPLPARHRQEDRQSALEPHVDEGCGYPGTPSKILFLQFCSWGRM